MNLAEMLKNPWVIFGLVGQVLFGLRFLIQWVASEIRKESHIPIVFWYFSILGGMVLLTYAIYRKDPVFILGQSTGLIVYLRNLRLIYLKRFPKGDDDDDFKAGEASSNVGGS